MATTPITLSQTAYLMQGGPYALPLAQLREKGIIPESYEYHEYPKILHLNERWVDQDRAVSRIVGKETITEMVTERVKVYDSVTVNSAEEEERVLNGGKPSAVLEEERQGLLLRAKQLGLKVDPAWTLVRLRRELGEEMDKPEASPADEMARLEAELATLRKMQDMQAEIEALKAKIAPPAEDVEQMRADLAALGVKVDGRWSAAKLRQELEAATAGKAA